MTQILDGRVIRNSIAEALKAEIIGKYPPPKLAIIQVGDIAESNKYIEQKMKFGEKIGASVQHEKLSEYTSEADIIKTIDSLNNNPTIHGIIVQLPLPDHLKKDHIIDTINVEKDVDGLSSVSLKMLMEGKTDGFIPATSKGILTLLHHYKIPIEGQNVVIVGRSTLVGKPTALLLLNENATVTICHSKTRDLATITKTANILVVAAGQANLITKDYVSENQVIIDVGINLLENLSPTKRKLSTKPQSEPEPETTDGKLVGDVEFKSVGSIVKAISPVPGGVGPMTVASLFQNLYQAYKNQGAT